MLLTIITFVFTLGLLILVHEFGHFIVAKRAGAKVEEFGFGLPPRVFGFRKGETIYSFNLLPFGGFVKIYGEMGEEPEKAPPKKKRLIKSIVIGDKPSKSNVASDKKRAFYNQPLSTRVKIIAAGVIMNILLAACLLSFGHWLGLPTAVEDGDMTNVSSSKVQIVQVVSGAPADEAGIKMGDTILEVGNWVLGDKAVQTVEEVQDFIWAYKGSEVALTVQRGKEIFKTKVVPREDPPEHEGPLGIALTKTTIVRYPWYRAIYMGFLDTGRLTYLIVVTFGSLFWRLATTGRLAAEIAGPVGIFNMTGQVAQLGFIYVLQFISLFSINLAIINILPFPALDGGRLLFLAVEKIKGSPVSQKIERTVHTIGFGLLILLMLAITWQDIIKLF